MEKKRAETVSSVLHLINLILAYTSADLDSVLPPTKAVADAWAQMPYYKYAI